MGYWLDSSYVSTDPDAGPVPLSSILEWQFWLYPPGVSVGTPPSSPPDRSQRWGQLTHPTLAALRQDLQRQQNFELTFNAWLGRGRVRNQHDTYFHPSLPIATTAKIAQTNKSSRVEAIIGGWRERLSAHLSTCTRLMAAVGVSSRAICEAASSMAGSKGRAAAGLLAYTSLLADIRSQLHSLQTRLAGASSVAAESILANVQDLSAQLDKLDGSLSPFDSPSASLLPASIPGLLGNVGEWTWKWQSSYMPSNFTTSTFKVSIKNQPDAVTDPDHPQLAIQVIQHETTRKADRGTVTNVTAESSGPLWSVAQLEEHEFSEEECVHLVRSGVSKQHCEVRFSDGRSATQDLVNQPFREARFRGIVDYQRIMTELHRRYQLLFDWKLRQEQAGEESVQDKALQQQIRQIAKEEQSRHAQSKRAAAAKLQTVDAAITAASRASAARPPAAEGNRARVSPAPYPSPSFPSAAPVFSTHPYSAQQSHHAAHGWALSPSQQQYLAYVSPPSAQYSYSIPPSDPMPQEAMRPPPLPHYGQWVPPPVYGAQYPMQWDPYAGSETPNAVIVQAHPSASACAHSIDEEFTPLGIICAIFFFPIGIICCLLSKESRCTRCGAQF